MSTINIVIYENRATEVMSTRDQDRSYYRNETRIMHAIGLTLSYPEVIEQLLKKLKETSSDYG